MTIPCLRFGTALLCCQPGLAVVFTPSHCPLVGTRHTPPTPKPHRTTTTSTGKYSVDRLPPGPRGNLFRQLLPGIQPVLTTLEAVAGSRRKTMSQVCVYCC